MTRAARSTLFTLVTCVAVIAAIVLALNDQRIAALVVLVCAAVPAALTLGPRRGTLARLDAQADVPTPTAEEVKAYRKTHPDKDLWDAVADMKDTPKST
ncbi:hypothetical protein C1Y63_12125 [Corynebacterium sp. 13CS0277]|uniref:hypothetical protein n=1 Tax=Corynebacterium sp. 13CS0277 TaxID=2071994 RepID=UPI000D032EFB|nr:hypothetical protein [Corynebacterium sp. 13CS0277]PRQ10326.1 hypothetical protein C1Y63_12125 [Corynebacterium sp. 13CS0277]